MWGKCDICGNKSKRIISDINFCENCFEELIKLRNGDNSVIQYFENQDILNAQAREYIQDIIDANNSKPNKREVYNEKINELGKEVIITTSNNLEGYKILDYIDVISVDKIMGVGIKTKFKSIGDMFASLTGDELYAINERISNIKDCVKNELKMKAAKLGANSIIAIDYETVLTGINVIMVSINGTAVRVEKE